MIFTKSKIDGLYIIEPELKNDERGFLMKIFCKKELAKQGLTFDIVQVNQSLAKKKGTIRGLHFQREPKGEAKMVRCLKGAIYDVAVDLRKNSLTYGQWVFEELTQDNKKILLIPKGCAHGFQTLSNNSEVLYFSSEFYSPQYESGIRFNDPFFGITWPIKNPILSVKDKNWPLIINEDI